MKKRQTVSQPNIDGTIHTLLEQKGDENLYRLTGRKGEGNAPGELIRVLGTDTKINTYAGQKLVSHQQDVEDKSNKVSINFHKRIQVAVREFWNLYVEYKKSYPLITKFDFINTKEGRDIINTLLDNASWEESKILLGNSFIKSLEVFGLKCEMNDFSSGIRYIPYSLLISQFGNDKIREQEIEKRISRFSEVLSQIYASEKKVNPSLTSINVFNYPEGRKAAELLLKNANTVDVKILLGEALQKSLEKYNLHFTMPEIDYDNHDYYNGGWLKKSSIRNMSIAA